VLAWLDQRLGLRALRYPVPEHANGVLYTLGGMTLFAFAILFASGIYLAQFYHPDPASAHDSVVYITTRAPGGDFVRGIHYWAAYIVSILVGLHLLRTFVSGSYKAPRELNWLIGVGLLAVVMLFVFTGTVTKWDQEGYEALVHNTAAANLVGALGGWFSPDFTSSVPQLIRVYFAHVMILPSLFALLIAAHIFQIKVQGMAPLGRADERDTDSTIDPSDKAAVYGEPIRPFTSHIRKILGWGLAVTALAMALAVAFVPPLQQAPIQGIEITKPPFLFWWLYTAEDFIGLKGLLVIPAIFFGLLAIVPFVDRGTVRSPRRRVLILVAGAVVLALLVAATIYTGVTPPKAHTHM
jgi:ubiquinol-cytochrome c reductase cytochrome b subunit